MPPKRPSHHQIGQVGESQLRLLLESAGCSVSELSPDYGEDLHVELTSSDEFLTGISFYVQVKSTAKELNQQACPKLPGVKVGHFEKWSSLLQPVAVVFWSVTEKVGFYEFANQPYDLRYLAVPEGPKTRTIAFDKSKSICETSIDGFLKDVIAMHEEKQILLSERGFSEQTIERICSQLETLGLLNRVTKNGERAVKLSAKARDEISSAVADIGAECRKVYANDVVRRAIVRVVGIAVLDRQKITDVQLAEFITSCLRVLEHMLPVDDWVSFLSSRGHPYRTASKIW